MRFLWIPAIALFIAITPGLFVDGEYMIGPGVYHVAGGSWPGDNGPARVVLAGHTPGVFGDLDALAIGDVIMLRSDVGNVIYMITARYITTVEGWQWPAPNGDDIALVTCYNGERQRLIIYAERVN